MLHDLSERDHVADYAVTTPSLPADERPEPVAAPFADFDPDGLYAAEAERDEALSFLIASVPATAFISLTARTATYRLGTGDWKRETEWTAFVATGQISDGKCAYAPSPMAAAEKVVALVTVPAVVPAVEPEPVALVTVRQRPEWREILTPSTDAIGQIDPATAADFLELVEAHHGPAQWLTIDTEGRVFVTVRITDAGEASELGTHVARHLTNCGVPSPVQRVEVRVEDDVHRPVIILTSGEEIACPRIASGEAFARKYGEEIALTHLPTVLPAAVANVATAAA